MKDVGFFNSIARALWTRFDTDAVSLATVKSYVRDISIFDWKGFTVNDGGDTVETSAQRALSLAGDRWDKSFLRVSSSSLAYLACTEAL